MIKSLLNLFPGLKNVIKKTLLSEYDKYPSIFNDGNLHIMKAINYLHEYGLEKGYLIIDVGAARGDISSIFASHFPLNTINAYEPIQSSFSILNETAKKFENIIPINKALGNVNCRRNINIANRITSSSLFDLNPQSSDNFITQNINFISREEIEICTLDSENLPDSKIGLLKLDVQGFETEVLKGAKDALSRTYFVLVELCNHNYYKGGAKYYEVDECLREYGFELQNFIPSLRDGKKILEWDSIYMNKDLIQ